MEKIWAVVASGSCGEGDMPDNFASPVRLAQRPRVGGKATAFRVLGTSIYSSCTGHGLLGDPLVD